MHLKQILLMGVLVAGCVTETAYQRGGTSFSGTADGYDDFPIKVEQQIYEIRFQGNKFTTPQTLQNHVQRRAKELCSSKGFNNFETLSSNTECTPDLFGNCVKNTLIWHVKCK